MLRSAPLTSLPALTLTARRSLAPLVSFVFGRCARSPRLETIGTRPAYNPTILYGLRYTGNDKLSDLFSNHWLELLTPWRFVECDAPSKEKARTRRQILYRQNLPAGEALLLAAASSSKMSNLVAGPFGRAG